MTFYHLLSIALIQGITEFLPISSSGHLILLPRLSNLPDQGLFIDVAVHLGTLLAVLIYFWKDTHSILLGFYDLSTGNSSSKSAKLLKFLILVTIPVIVIGAIFKVTGLIEMLRTIEVIGWTMVIFGVLLYLADRYSTQKRTEFNLNLRHIIVLGLWQSLALIPGTSRAGATITAGLILGYKRRSAVRISMLMAIPTIFASGAYESYEIWQTKDTIPINDVALVTVLTFIFALLALNVMMRLLNKINFTPYVIYRILLGLLLLGLAYN